MKNLLTILILLIGFGSIAQDGYNQTDAYYNDIKSKTINIDQDKVVQMGIDITENSEYQYSYKSRRVKSRSVVVIYQRDDVVDINYKGYNDLILKFSKRGDCYTLERILGNKETVYSLWRQYFLKNAKPYQIEENYKYRVLKSDDIHYQLVNNSNHSVIQNRTR